MNCGPWSRWGRLEPSHSSVDAWANAQESRQHPAVIRGPWPRVGSFRAIPLIGGHWSKSSRRSPFLCSDGCSLGRSNFCSASTERTIDLLKCRLSTGGHLRLLFGTQLGLPRSDNQQTHSICFLMVGDTTSCGTRHFPIFVILVLLAFGCLALYSGSCWSVAYFIYDCICLVRLPSSASVNTPIRNDGFLIRE